MTESEKLKPAFNLACDVLVEALKTREVDDTAKLSIQTVSAFSKLKATERAGQTLQYVIIKDFAQENGDELKRMVRASLPELTPSLAALTG